MFISEPKTFHDAIKPLVYFNCFVGIGVLRQPNRSCATYFFMKFYTIFITLFNWTTIYITLGLMLEGMNSDNSSSTALTMFKLLVCVNSCITMVAPLLVWLRRKGLGDCLHQMPILDNTFQTILGARNEYRKLYIRLICQVSAIFLVMSLVAISDSAASLNVLLQLDIRTVSMLSTVTQTLHQPIQVMLLLDVNFCTFIGYLGKKFHDINESLLGLAKNSSTSWLGERLFVISQNVKKTTPGNKVRNTEPECFMTDKLHLLREIRKAHLEVCKLSRTINLVFGVQNLLSIGISFVMVTGLLYTIYSAFLWEKITNSNLQEVIPMVLWTTIYAFKIWLVNHSCWSVSNKAGRTEEVIYELLNSRVDKEFRKEIQEFSLQMLQNPVHFNACGFFILDYTFVQGVIGSITTYLVILIQMTHVPDSPTANTGFGRNSTKVSPNHQI